MSTSPRLPNEKPNRPRNPALALQMYPALGMPSEASPIGMNEFAGLIESEIHVSGDT
jgi:hypothetical protein